MKREEIIEKYGKVKLKFSHYYKYTFTYSGIASDGVKVIAGVGGGADDIYKLSVDSDLEETINGLDPDFYSLEKDGKEIASFDGRW